MEANELQRLCKLTEVHIPRKSYTSVVLFCFRPGLGLILLAVDIYLVQSCITTLCSALFDQRLFSSLF